MPAYYSFLDDDVLYDIKHGNGTDLEANSEIKQRIIDDTPSLKPLYTINSVETELSDNPTSGNDGNIWMFGQTEITDDQYVNIYDQDYRPTGDVNTKFLQNTLGTSKHGSEYAPAWDVVFIQGEIDPSNTYNYTSSIPSNNSVPVTASALHIPQIKCDVVYTIEVVSETEKPIQQSANLETPYVVGGEYIDVDEDQALMRILEENGFVHNESFEIEVFEILDDEELVQLKFLNKNNLVSSYKIDRDILIENSNQPPMTPDKTTVEYYFDIRVDEEIPVLDICEGLEELASEGVFIKDVEIECPDLGPGSLTIGDGGAGGSSDNDEECADVQCDDDV